MRDINQEVATAAKSDSGYGFFIAVDLDYPDGKVRFNSLQKDIEINGNNFIGIGQLGEVSSINESAETKSSGYTLTLTGIPEYLDAGQTRRMVDYLGQQDVQGRECIVHFGFTDSQWRVVGSHIINVGFMDAQDVTIGAVTVTCESIPIDWARPRVRYLSDNDQQSKYPGDNICKYVAAMPGMTLKWGKA